MISLVDYVLLKFLRAFQHTFFIILNLFIFFALAKHYNLIFSIHLLKKCMKTNETQCDCIHCSAYFKNLQQNQKKEFKLNDLRL